jgi:hypothetical protein
LNRKETYFFTRVHGFPARNSRKEKPRLSSNGSTLAVISRTG